MGLLRELLFENLGVKLVALVLAVVVYLHVYTERPATMLVAFPVQLTDLPESLAVDGPLPGTVQAELRGTGKQLIRLKLTEPRIKISLAGIGTGRFERTVSSDDLPLIPSDRLEIQRLIGPRIIDLQIDRKATRELPVAARVTGAPPAGYEWTGAVLVTPDRVTVRGPARRLAELDSITLQPVRIEDRRDTVRARVAPADLPMGCEVDPTSVAVLSPLRHATR